MKNIVLLVEYDGSNYCGWQTQKSAKCKAKSAKRKIKTIQEAIEKALQKILQEKVNLTAAGRTDSGVHAYGQVCNFKTKTRLKPESIKYALNSNLPKDIAVRKAKYADLKFHSQFCAKSKVYRYALLNRKCPSAILRNFIYYYTYPLNIKLMQTEAKTLLGRHNFKSFQAKDIIERYPLVNLKKISIKKDKDLIYFDIEADRFLYNMARNIVGTLIEIGRGYFKKGAMKDILKKKDRFFAGPTAPPKGLMLLKVKY